MRFLFVMDPVSTIDRDVDTSFALMLAAARRGHRVDHCAPIDVYAAHGTAHARVRAATCDRAAPAPVVLGPAEDLALSTVDAVFLRKDPPFDAAYLWLTQLLELVRHDTFVVNDPRGLRDANEKLYALHFATVMPETLVTADPARIRAFLLAVGGAAVVKDVDGHGGERVFLLRAADENLSALLEVATDHGRRLTVAQRYLPEVRGGDKRILLLDGEPLGAINRVARADELRSNLHVGGTAAPAELTAADRRVIAALAPRLRADGLWFVGLDVIGGYLTEVNVTSPTGLQQLARFTGTEPADTVVEWVERRAATHSRA